MGFFCVIGPIFSLVSGALGYHSSVFILHSLLCQGVRVRSKGSVLGFAAGDFEFFESCGFRRFCGQTLRLSILLAAEGRPVLRNICKIAKFVDTAENESKEAFLI